MAKDATFEKTDSSVENITIPADQGSVVIEPFNGCGSSPEVSHLFSNPFPPVADTNDDEREEKMSSSSFGYGQLPEDYLELLGGHYASLPVEADTLSERSIPAPFDSSPAMRGETDRGEGTTPPMAHPVSADQLVIGEDTYDKVESLIPSSRND